MHAYYDPPIHEAALVTINGQPAGALWHPPYRLDISKLLKPGQNHIEIHVYNTALNAWSALPPHDYKPLIEKYGDRFQMQDLNKVQPIPSGILGTIHLVTEEANESPLRKESSFRPERAARSGETRFSTQTAPQPRQRRYFCTQLFFFTLTKIAPSQPESAKPLLLSIPPWLLGIPLSLLGTPRLQPWASHASQRNGALAPGVCLFVHRDLADLVTQTP